MNPCGGAERLTLATMHALSQKCVNFDLTTCIQPNMTKLEMHTVAKSLLFFRKQKKLNLLESLEELFIDRITEKGNYDFTVNTHGDTLPYYHRSFPKNNADI